MGSGFTIARASVAEFSRDAFFGTAANEISNNNQAIFCSQNSALRFGAVQTAVGNAVGSALISGCNVSGPFPVGVP